MHLTNATTTTPTKRVGLQWYLPSHEMNQLPSISTLLPADWEKAFHSVCLFFAQTLPFICHLNCICLYTFQLFSIMTYYMLLYVSNIFTLNSLSLLKNLFISFTSSIPFVLPLLVYIILSYLAYPTNAYMLLVRYASSLVL